MTEFGREAADLLKHREPQHGGGTAAERGAPRILGCHDHIEEVALLVRPDTCEREIALHRIWIDEVLRRLNDADIILAE